MISCVIFTTSIFTVMAELDANHPMLFHLELEAGTAFGGIALGLLRELSNDEAVDSC
jgi:hypothetical protein